ncbi:MAG: GreA/GreB family elongation factor [Chloroflexi bacterium]|nr:GreA/GreB family elongation factor [Chloroflexota bacterium]
MDDQNITLSEAANHFLDGLAPEERGASQQEVSKFVRWFGVKRPLDKLTAAEVESFAERLSISDTDYLRKLGLVRAFLVSAKKEGWSKINLAVHLKGRKGKPKLRSAPKPSSSKSVPLTREGHSELKAELTTLRSKRLEAIDEIRLAAADKDFRENVPLQAAREQRGQLEGRIMELEEALKSAVIIDEKQVTTLKINIGDSFILYDFASSEEVNYTLVSTREADPAKGKISGASPVGRAVIGREPGEVVEVIVPAGKLRYQIKYVKR